MNLESEDGVSDAVKKIIDPLWQSRGKENMVYPDQELWEKKRKELESLENDLSSAVSGYKALASKLGKKNRLTTKENADLTEFWYQIFELSGIRYDRDSVDRPARDYGEMSNSKIGQLEKELKSRKQIEKKSEPLVFLSEYFSAEDFGVVLLEVLSNKVNFNSKFREHRNAHPELLDFVHGAINKWVDEHRGEDALFKKEHIDKSKKKELLVGSFVSRLQSFLRHKDSENEVLVVANLLSRI
jgi:hypothetical protein